MQEIHIREKQRTDKEKWSDNMEKENIQDAINNIKYLLKESERHSQRASMGYDEGWYNGECNAYEIVLEILEEITKG